MTDIPHAAHLPGQGWLRNGGRPPAMPNGRCRAWWLLNRRQDGRGYRAHPRSSHEAWSLFGSINRPPSCSSTDEARDPRFAGWVAMSKDGTPPAMLPSRNRAMFSPFALVHHKPVTLASS
jgi:hypothetical protein